MINLYNRDCLEAMKEMKNNSFDLAIVDPPYREKNQPTKDMRKNDFKKTLNNKPGQPFFLIAIPFLQTPPPSLLFTGLCGKRQGRRATGRQIINLKV